MTRTAQGEGERRLFNAALFVSAARVCAVCGRKLLGGTADLIDLHLCAIKLELEFALKISRYYASTKN